MVTFNPQSSGLALRILARSSIEGIENVSYLQSAKFSLSNFSVKNFLENDCARGYPINPNCLIRILFYRGTGQKYRREDQYALLQAVSLLLGLYYPGLHYNPITL